MSLKDHMYFQLKENRCDSREFGEGNGTPLQYSCLEKPMDGGAWWAAVYGVAQSQTRLKRLSSSSSRGGACNAAFGILVP